MLTRLKPTRRMACRWAAVCQLARISANRFGELLGIAGHWRMNEVAWRGFSSAGRYGPPAVFDTWGRMTISPRVEDIAREWQGCASTGQPCQVCLLVHGFGVRMKPRQQEAHT